MILMKFSFDPHTCFRIFFSGSGFQPTGSNADISNPTPNTSKYVGSVHIPGKEAFH